MPFPILPPLPRLALFLDFDGTLVDIAVHPELIVISPTMLTTLSELSGALSGALAIVTGRDIATIDRLLAPLRLPVAGIHGATRRDWEGRLYLPPDSGGFLEEAQTELSLLVVREPGLLIERKSASIALHYRARPELETLCIDIVQGIAARFSHIEVKRGKMVVEAKPGYANKGSAIKDFMSEKPFAGRHPVVAGDDITDEDAFRAVNLLGGTSIKIGEGETTASHRMPSTADFTAWLVELATSSPQQKRLERDQS